MKRSKKGLALALSILLLLLVWPGPIGVKAEDECVASNYATATDGSHWRAGFDMQFFGLTEGNHVHFDENSGVATTEQHLMSMDANTNAVSYRKTYQWGDKVHCSHGAIAVDVSKVTDLLDTGLYMKVSFPMMLPGWLTGNLFEWQGIRGTGIALREVADDCDSILKTNSNTIENSSISVTSDQGREYTYTLADRNGNRTYAGCTDNPQAYWQRENAYMANMTFGPYWFRFQGDLPKAGESVSFRVWAYGGLWDTVYDAQYVDGWTDLTITGYCSHSQGLNYTCNGDLTHTGVCPVCGETVTDSCVGLTPTDGICTVCQGNYYCDVTLNDNGATTPGDPSVVAVAFQNMPSVTPPEKVGYTFMGYFGTENEPGTEYYDSEGRSVRSWNSFNDGELWAVWAPNTDTPYTVEHYYMNPEGTYVGVEPVVRTFTGTTGQWVYYSSLAQELPHFSLAPELSDGSCQISADGSLVIRLYYEREQFDLTLQSGTGIDAVYGGGRVYYGAEVTATAVTEQGYDFAGWDSSDPGLLPGSEDAVYTFTMPAGNVTLTAGAEKQTISVSVQQNAEAYTVDAPAGTVEWGDDYTFSITLNPAYTQTQPTVTDSNSNVLGATVSGSTYTYTLHNVQQDTQIYISGLQLNSYTVTVSAGRGSVVTPGTSPVSYGGSYTFTVAMDEAYSDTVPEVTVNGASVSLVRTDTENEYSCTIENITENLTIAVADASKNLYAVTLPTGEGYTASVGAGVDLSAVEYGTDLVFTVTPDAQHDRSDIRVLYLGEPLTSSEGGAYTVHVERNIEAGEITVENVVLNSYYIALALDAQPGYRVVPAAGYNPRATVSGSDFCFRVDLEPAYSASAPTVRVSADGGETYAELTPSDGIYRIENILSDCIVTVDDVVINTYTVVFTDSDGAEAETHTDVPYGTEVIYGGTEPAKADEILSDTVVNNADGSETRTTVTRIYTFAGWDAATDCVTRDLTVHPLFETYEKTATVVKQGDTVISEDETTEPGFVTFLYLDDQAAVLYRQNVEKGQPFAGYDQIPEKVSANPFGTYTFLGWDTDGDGVADIPAGASTATDAAEVGVTYTAVFSYELGVQHVRFYSYDGGTLLFEGDFNRGETAVYTGSVPSRRDQANEYTFVGWSYVQNGGENDALEQIYVADEDLTLYAAYRAEPIVYTYRYVCDGAVLKEGTFFFGDGYSYNGVEPARAATTDSVYVFAHWYTEQIGYLNLHTAVFREEARSYPVDISSGEGVRVEAPSELLYGEDGSLTVTVESAWNALTPKVSSAAGETLVPTSVSDGANGIKIYTYTLSAAGDSSEEITDRLTLTVEAEKNTYSVSFKDADGTVLKTVTVAYGEIPSYGGTPERAATAQYSYVFSGWDRPLEPATEDAVYTALFRESVNLYTVTFINYNGAVLGRQTVPYGAAAAYSGAAPVRPTANGTSYTFIGWDKNTDSVTKDTVVTAQYKSEKAETPAQSQPDASGHCSLLEWLRMILKKLFSLFNKQC